jgi:hypothetical protein
MLYFTFPRYPTTRQNIYAVIRTTEGQFRDIFLPQLYVQEKVRFKHTNYSWMTTYTLRTIVLFRVCIDVQIHTSKGSFRTLDAILRTVYTGCFTTLGHNYRR